MNELKLFTFFFLIIILITGSIHISELRNKQPYIAEKEARENIQENEPKSMTQISLESYLDLINSLTVTISEVEEIEQWFYVNKETLKESWFTKEIQTEIRNIREFEEKIETTKIFIEECILSSKKNFNEAKELRRKLPKYPKSKLAFFITGREENSQKKYTAEELYIIYKTLDRNDITNIEEFYLKFIQELKYQSNERD